MSFDYDVVVIGSTPEGIYAAQKAVLLKARVALVTQSEEEYLNHTSFIYNRCLNELVNSLSKFKSNPWGIWQEAIAIPEVSLLDIRNWANLIQENITTEHSLANLAVLGVDVIYGKGEFCRLPKQAFLVRGCPPNRIRGLVRPVNNREGLSPESNSGACTPRQLRSRNYLLATGAKYKIKSEYQKQFNCLTPDNLWQQNLENFPKNLVIIGDSYRSLELAQGLARLGKKITLATSNKKILAAEAIEASKLFQAQLAADGIKLLLNSPLTQIQLIQDKTWIQLGNYAIETEAIVFTDRREPNITELNLAGVGVKYLQQGIIVNEKLQTTNQAIYACGDLLGGNSLPHIAQYEVDIALKNMFSFPWFKKDYRYLPIVILTQPNLARIGLTNHQLQQNNQDIYVITQHFKSIFQAQITELKTGWCQFIIKDNGEILGCTIICDRAIELINIITMMMQHKIKLTRNPIQGLLKQEIPYITPSFSEILNQVAIAFHQQKIQRNQSLSKRLETWFDWRR